MLSSPGCQGRAGSFGDPSAQHRQGSGAAASTSARASHPSYQRHASYRLHQPAGIALPLRWASRCRPLLVACSVKGKQEPPPGGGAPGPRKPKGNKARSFRSYDGALLLGDLVMLTATEVSSERVSWDVLPVLLAVVLGCWTVSASVLDDYNGAEPSTDNWYLSLLGAPFLAVVNGCITWALAVTLMLACYSLLVANNKLDSAPILEDILTEDLSPQLEVSIALLLTMPCWRGIAAKVRY